MQIWSEIVGKTSEAMAHALRETGFLAVAKHEAEHTQFKFVIARKRKLSKQNRRSDPKRSKGGFLRVRSTKQSIRSLI